MKVSEKWGDSVDSAVAAALKDLKLSREEVDVEVLEESSKGFLGIGSTLAHVRVTPKEEIPTKRFADKVSIDSVGDIDDILANLPENRVVTVADEIRENYDLFEQEEMEDARALEKKKRATSKTKEKKNRKEKAEKREKNISNEPLLVDVSQLQDADDHPVQAFLSELAENMGIDLTFKVKTGNGIVHIEAGGPDTATIIGKRGQTLDAVQYLASLVVNKDSDDYTRVVIDAENYRAKREKTLENLANRLAGKVERSGRRITLEPMNPYERKVIHATLQSNPKVETRSEGRDPYRRVIIEKK